VVQTIYVFGMTDFFAFFYVRFPEMLTYIAVAGPESNPGMLSTSF
jgi:hypothetical protein